MARYVFHSDEIMLRGAASAVRSIGTPWARRALKVVCFIGLCALLAVSLYGRVWWVAAVFAFLAVLVPLGPHLDYWVSLRKLKRSVYYGSDAEVIIDDVGIKAAFLGAYLEQNWISLKKVVRRKDGFLVYFDQEPPRWWPDDGLKEGSVHEVEAILRANAGAYVPMKENARKTPN